LRHGIKTSGRKDFRKGGAWGRANGSRELLQGCNIFEYQRHTLREGRGTEEGDQEALKDTPGMPWKLRV